MKLLLLTLFSNAIASVPDPTYFIAMPTVRTRPEWYLPLLPEIPSIVLKHIRKLRIALRPLPSFQMSGNDLDSDGIHLNALAGITYCQHLIDKPRYCFLVIICSDLVS